MRELLFGFRSDNTVTALSLLISNWQVVVDAPLDTAFARESVALASGGVGLGVDA